MESLLDILYLQEYHKIRKGKQTFHLFKKGKVRTDYLVTLLHEGYCYQRQKPSVSSHTVKQYNPRFWFLYLVFDTLIIAQNVGYLQHYRCRKVLKIRGFPASGHTLSTLKATIFQDIRIAFGWSISIPDISQSNSFHVRLRTSDLSLGQR